MILLIVFSLLFFFGVIVASAWNPNNPASVEDYIHYIAGKEKVNVSMVLSIAKCESGIRANAIGDKGKSFGVFQIYLPAHPYITKEQALNPWFNINWAIDRMAEGKWNMWSCYKNMWP